MEGIKVKVGMGDFKVGKDNDVLVTYGLGSCVGITIYDPDKKLGGMAHVMLPSSSIAKSSALVKEGKYADTAIRTMISSLISAGGDIINFEAKIFGGAKMFSFESERNSMDIGKRNVIAVKEELVKQRIPLKAEITGEDYGRTIELELKSGKVKVVSINKPVLVV